MRFLLMFALFVFPAFAQQLSPQQTVAQMLGSQLGLCFSSNATLQEQNNSLKAELTAANQKVKELEAKKPN